MSRLAVELQIAVRAARAAAEIHRSGRGTDLQVGSKSTAIDLVTRIDTESEAAIRQILAEAFPDDGVLGEEDVELDGQSGRRWLVDPLDGTLNYAHGFLYYCVSIALEVEGVVELGVVLDSTRDELFTATRGFGAELNGTPITVSSEERLARSMIATGFAYTPERMAENLELFGRVLPRSRALRRPGAAALDLCWTAAGRLDGFWEMYLQPWDVAAGGLIVAEAGGTVTDEEGRPQRVTDRLVVATNGRIHDELLRTLRGG